MKQLEEILKRHSYIWLGVLCLKYGFVEIPPFPKFKKNTPYPQRHAAEKMDWNNLEKNFSRQALISLIKKYFSNLNFFNSLVLKIKDSHSTALFLKVLHDNDGELNYNKIIQKQ